MVAQRAETARHPGKWEFIGGKVESGEDLDQALVREVREETSLKVEPGKVLDVSVHDYGGDAGAVQVTFIECRTEKTSGVATLNPDVYQKIEWANADKLRQLDWIEADNKFATRLADSLSERS